MERTVVVQYSRPSETVTVPFPTSALLAAGSWHIVSKLLLGSTVT